MFGNMTGLPGSLGTFGPTLMPRPRTSTSLAELAGINAAGGLPLSDKLAGRGGERMAERTEHDPGEPAPAEGIYEMLNIFGSPLASGSA